MTRHAARWILTRHAARWVLLASLLLLTGCGLFHRTASAPDPQPRYVVGKAYQAGGVWYYPREDFRLDATGLAIVLPERTGLTANGEAWDPMMLAGAHATLQLPAIVRVTDLETGLQILIRVNDRGPANPGRLIGLARHAADRLGIPPGAVARVRVQVEYVPSQALRDQLQGNAGLVIASAPRESVRSEALLPPPGLRQSARVRTVLATMPVEGVSAAPVAAPARLPDFATRVPVNPGQLWLDAGEFGHASDANRVQARLATLPAMVDRVQRGGSAIFRVRSGPFHTVGQADSALDRAMRAGVTDARIVIE